MEARLYITLYLYGQKRPVTAGPFRSPQEGEEWVRKNQVRMGIKAYSPQQRD